MTSQTTSTGCLGTLLYILGLGPRVSQRLPLNVQERSTFDVQDEPVRKTSYPYRVRDQFFSPAECSFFQVLQSVVGEKAVILAKVRLFDIFYVTDRQENRGAQSRIDRKHVDYLLCHPKTLQPIAGIELDDSSHQREDRQARDEFVEAVFKDAGLPLLRVPVRRGYDTSDLTQLLAPHIGADDTPLQLPKRPVPPAAVSVTARGIPLCPKCGAEMVLRVAKRGQHQGQKFYACTNYPDCKTILPTK